MSPAETGRGYGSLCFPRVSGDEPVEGFDKLAEAAFSPREWG